MDAIDRSITVIGFGSNARLALTYASALARLAPTRRQHSSKGYY
jgi:hypothetical protein